jgi:phosphonate transport system substrate-binding protein
VRIRFATYLAPCVRPAYQAVADEVGRRLGLTAELVTGRSLRQIAEGQFDVSFICSPPYIELASASPPAAYVLAAPVLTDPAFGGRPAYRSDVIVRADSRFQSFADLRGASWAFNEPSSFSGYYAIRARLAALGERDGYFGAAVRAGWHERAITMVADALVDASAIDCQVLSIVLAAKPKLGARLRVIDSIGPAPIQPVVASGRLDAELRGRVQKALLDLTANPAVAGVLKRAGLERFVVATDADYDPIRVLLERAREVKLAPVQPLHPNHSGGGLDEHAR